MVRQLQILAKQDSLSFELAFLLLGSLMTTFIEVLPI